MFAGIGGTVFDVLLSDVEYLVPRLNECLDQGNPTKLAKQ